MRDYSFGNFLHELRTRRGLTQYQLGSLVGVSDKAVSKWENGSSKPQTNILYRLSEVLGISTDELLSCKYRSQKARNRKGIFAMRKILWNKALDAMHEHYGSHSPLEITNRFLTEQAEMQDTDMIVYLNALAELTTAAAKQKSHIWVRGGIGASFVAYLLNATDVNPLKPHYYCPDCHTVIFDSNADKLIEQGIPASKVIAYRDDVFNYIKEHMLNSGYTDTGFAYKVIEDTRRGLYAKNGIPSKTKAQLESIGMDNWFTDSISRINYLFPKAHGVTYVKLAATLMWYKIYYLKEFSRDYNLNLQQRGGPSLLAL